MDHGLKTPIKLSPSWIIHARTGACTDAHTHADTNSHTLTHLISYKPAHSNTVSPALFLAPPSLSFSLSLSLCHTPLHTMSRSTLSITLSMRHHHYHRNSSMALLASLYLSGVGQRYPWQIHMGLEFCIPFSLLNYHLTQTDTQTVRQAHRQAYTLTTPPTPP